MPSKKWRENLWRRKRNWGWGVAIVNTSPWLFIGCVATRKERTAFFLRASGVITGYESSPFWVPNYIELRFLFINFFTFSPFDQDLFLKAPLI